MSQRLLAHPQFSTEQRNRLKSLDLNPKQLDILEQEALPICRLYLSPLATLTEVKGELKLLLKNIHKAKEAMEKLYIDQYKTPARQEAFNRIIQACPETENDLIDRTIDDISKLHNVVQCSLDGLPTKQRRHRSNPAPVARIAKALLDGFIKWHNTDNSRKPLPPYLIEISSSEGSFFREVVSICGEAVGDEYPEQERAIKAYIKEMKIRKQTQRESMGITVKSTKK